MQYLSFVAWFKLIHAIAYTSGVGGDQTDDSLNESGAVYLN